MRQNIIVIGDTHFGIKNNSMTWLKHQSSGFEEIIQYVEKSFKEYDETIVVHMGDLFDSRSSINPLIYKEVLSLVRKLGDALKPTSDAYADHTGQVYLIGGNHDYYYPWESKHNFTGIQMLPEIDNVNIIVDDYVKVNDLVFIPWFSFHNMDKLKEIMGEINENDILFTHTDPFHFEPGVYDTIRGHLLVTGHIHQPTCNIKQNLLVTGASFPTDFTDTNSSRGFWTLTRCPKSNLEVVFHAIDSSIHFHTLREESLENWEIFGINEDDYVNIVIRQSNVDAHKDTIKELNDKFNTSITYITEKMDVNITEQDVLTVDVVCQKLLPGKLKDLYQKMIEACEQKE